MGMNVTPGRSDKILDYLATHLGLRSTAADRPVPASLAVQQVAPAAYLNGGLPTRRYA